MTPARILTGGMAALILLGGLLLSLPVASQTGESLPFFDALFTATSAVTVTGLIVVDTGTFFSTFGQIVIITLAQIGGIGFIAVATFLTIWTGKKIGLKERLVLQQSLNVTSMEGLIRLTQYVVLLTLAFEFVFAVILAYRFAQEMPYGQAIYFGIFHSISAFCHAGFDLFGGYQSFTRYVGDPLVILTLTTSIILGGLGFTVLVDLGRKIRGERLTLHTKLVLIATAVLFVSGTLGIYLLEHNNELTMDTLSEGDKWLAAAFASATTRSGGLTTVDYGGMTDSTLLLSTLLMFIGAGPGSTGGGIKVITATIILLFVWTVMTNKEHTVAFKRTIPPGIISKSLIITVLSAAFVMTGAMILTITEDQDFLHLLFEVTSAFGTVGLSVNLTPTLSPAGKMVIMIMMYIGRLGPLTLALAFAARHHEKAYLKYPEGNVYVG